MMSLFIRLMRAISQQMKYYKINRREPVDSPRWVMLLEIFFCGSLNPHRQVFEFLPQKTVYFFGDDIQSFSIRMCTPVVLSLCQAHIICKYLSRVLTREISLWVARNVPIITLINVQHIWIKTVIMNQIIR